MCNRCTSGQSALLAIFLYPSYKLVPKYAGLQYVFKKCLYFLYNSVKNQPISIIFGIRRGRNLTLEKYQSAHITYKLLLYYLGKCKEWFFKTIFHSNFDGVVNLSIISIVFVIFNLWTMALYWPMLWKYLEWPHSTRVAEASASETECIPAAHCGWADRIVAHTDSMLVFVHFEHSL